MKLNRNALLLISVLGASAAMAQATTVEVFKSPYCGCCGKWVRHMEAAGFRVEGTDVAAVDPDTLLPPTGSGAPERLVVLIAAHLGTTRLIDNLELGA